VLRRLCAHCTRIFEWRLALDDGVFLRGKIRISANTLAVEAQRGIVCRVCGLGSIHFPCYVLERFVARSARPRPPWPGPLFCFVAPRSNGKA